MRRITKPRCVLVYALAPDTLTAADANRQFNAFVADTDLPLAIFHDHFIGQPGGIAIFFLENTADQEQLLSHPQLADWHVETRPMIFSRSPAAFDEQIDFTLRTYRNSDWETLQREQRPVYGDPRREAETAQEDDSE